MSNTRKTIALFILVASMMSALIPPVSMATAYKGSGTPTIKGVLTANTEENWEKTQYQFFKTMAELNIPIQINLSYSGDLDLDLWVYIDEEAKGSDQEHSAWDIAHCKLEKEPTLYSAIKTTETSPDQPEQVEYVNLDFTTPRAVYILIFVENGVGDSEYLLNATQIVTAIKEDDYDTCWTVTQAWALFAAGCIIMSILIVYTAKKAGRTREQKLADKTKKEEKLAKKKGAEQKAKSAMSARKGDGRR